MLALVVCSWRTIGIATLHLFGPRRWSLIPSVGFPASKSQRLVIRILGPHRRYRQEHRQTTDFQSRDFGSDPIKSIDFTLGSPLASCGLYRTACTYGPLGRGGSANGAWKLGDNAGSGGALGGAPLGQHGQ